jgi:hypothetical protein
MNHQVNQRLDAIKMVEDSKFRPEIEFAANTVIQSLFYLQQLSKELGLPIEEITPNHVVEELRAAVAQTQVIH